MNISATRRVTGSSSTRKASSSRASKSTSAFNANEQNVEMIDVSNKVQVNADTYDDERGQKNKEKPSKEKDDKSLISQNTYVPGAVEALTADGVYDGSSSAGRSQNQKVGVYHTNQNIYDREENAELDRYYNENYVKHLYEKNEPLEEIDELV